MQTRKDIIQALEEHKSEVPSHFKEKAEFRINNRLWLRHSRKVATRILSAMWSQHMDLQALSSKTSLPVDTLTEMVSGHYDFHLSEISLFEDVLLITLM